MLIKTNFYDKYLKLDFFDLNSLFQFIILVILEIEFYFFLSFIIYVLNFIING